MSTAGMIKYILAILFVSVFIKNSLANDTVSIFQFNGALQCHESNIVTPDMAAQQLEEAGLKILGKSSKKVPYGIPKKCGAPTGDANVFDVDAAEWKNFVKKQPGTLGFGVWVFDRPTLEVLNMMAPCNVEKVWKFH